MPTVIRQNGFRIVIYPNDHLPCHVHPIKGDGEVRIDLGCSEPPTLPSLLNHATHEQLAEVEVTPSGYGLHWESLDVDLGVPQLVAGLFGTKGWMAQLNWTRTYEKSPPSKL